MMLTLCCLFHQWSKLQTVIQNLSSNVEEFSSLLESVS